MTKLKVYLASAGFLLSTLVSKNSLPLTYDIRSTISYSPLVEIRDFSEMRRRIYKAMISLNRISRVTSERKTFVNTLLKCSNLPIPLLMKKPSSKKGSERNIGKGEFVKQ